MAARTVWRPSSGPARCRPSPFAAIGSGSAARPRSCPATRRGYLRFPFAREWPRSETAGLCTGNLRSRLSMASRNGRPKFSSSAARRNSGPSGSDISSATVTKRAGQRVAGAQSPRDQVDGVGQLQIEAAEADRTLIHDPDQREKSRRQSWNPSDETHCVSTSCRRSHPAPPCTPNRRRSGQPSTAALPAPASTAAAEPTCYCEGSDRGRECC